MLVECSPGDRRAMSAARIRAKAGRGPTKYRQTVQWKQTNVRDGVVIVDEHLLSKLIKKEPIDKYYKLDPEPFATGMFASVRRCKSLDTGQVFAAKFSSRMRYGEDCTKEIHHEIALLSLCSPSPRIVRLHDVFQTPREIIIVMEYAPGGDMQTIIDDNLVPFENDVVKFVQPVVEGLAYLHHRKIAHLDIKPQNLVMMGEFPDCDVKVCDFEISRVILEGSEIHEVLGTPEYVAPEILHYEPITLSADMWSLGVTTYVLLTGFSPFGGETDQETFLNISRAQVDFPEELFEDVSEDAKDFIRRLLVRNPSARMTAKECLRHPWLANNRKTPSTGTSKATPKQETNPEPRRVGCQTCPAPSNQNLRKYLSKSREALFEKVISQQKLHSSMKQEDLRKSTLIKRYNKTRRLCESQMSLVSKTREMAERQAMTRSREKLYGLRSLSKSHEVLNLYKSLVNLQQGCESKDNKDAPLPVILNTLTKTSDDICVAGEGQDNCPADLSKENNNDTGAVQVGSAAEEDDKAVRGEEDKENVNTGNAREATEANDVANNNVVRPRPTLDLSDLGDNSRVVEPPSPAVSNTDSLSLTEGISTSESDISEEDACSTGRPEPEDDEPRYTVAQLVSAYNMHQEIVTKTSLEVTMNSGSKISPACENTKKQKFPTGANALRLFIPNINISSRPKRGSRQESSIELPTPEEQRVEVPLIHEVAEKEVREESLTSQLGVEAPPPKYLRSGSVSSDTSKSSAGSAPSWEQPRPNALQKQKSVSNVAKTVELFNNVINSTPRPNRKSFSSPRPPPTIVSQPSDKIRRKSSPPTMKPHF